LDGKQKYWNDEDGFLLGYMCALNHFFVDVEMHYGGGGGN